MSWSTVITGGLVLVISYPAAGLASYLEDLVVLEVAPEHLRIAVGLDTDSHPGAAGGLHYDSHFVSPVSPP
jgi:hypothetical protein